MKFCRCLSLPIAAVACLVIIGCDSQNGQTTRKRRVVNEYHGIKVEDPYQWLENAADPAVRQWTTTQNSRARALLDKLPTRPLIEDRLTRLLTEPSTNYFSPSWRRGQLFFMKFQPPAQQPELVTLGSVTNPALEKVILDPNQLGTNGTSSIDWYVPSPDGSLVAVSLSESGSELGTLYIYETATGQRRPDAIPRVQGPTAGGSAAWAADGSGLFYTRYPRKGERPEAELDFFQQVYFHKLGTSPEQDTYEIGREFPRIAEIELQASTDGRHLLASVANGDGGEFAHYLRERSGTWRQVTKFEDQIRRVEFARDPLYIEAGKDDALYLLSRQDAPKGKILRLSLARLDLTNATTVIAQTTNVIRDFKPTASGLAIVYLKGGPSEFAFYDHFAKRGYDPNDAGEARGRSPAAVEEMVVTEGDEVLIREVTYVAPYVWWRYDARRSRDRAEMTALRGHSPVSFDDIEVAREMVESNDGTRIPLNILRRRGTRLDGQSPTILTGYGGYGISLTPHFDVSRRVWFDQDGIIAIANLRGGGEFGETWHQAGRLTNKQNVFDDFAACARFLIRSNYTNPSKLAVEGGSNGGLLMGALLTQQPELMQAVVSHVGIYDMLRVERDPNGTFNTTEFGSVADADQFKALLAYSPYHHVMDKTNYPAVLMLTGENDGRVNPAHSRKMVARLQAATGSARSILLRTSSSSGHGIGTALNEHIQQLTDVFAFLCDQLGIEYSVIDRGPWSGAVTPTSAVVKAKLVREGLNARLALSKSPLFTTPTFSDVVQSETNHYGIVAFTPAQLEPDTQYYYALEVNGRVDRKRSGEFRTFPAPGQASFTMAFASCARTASTNEVFDRIRENHPLFFMHMGDFHYLDIATNNQTRFRAAYDTVLASPQQATLYRYVPIVYMWDDHDFAGNRSDGDARARPASRLTYDEYVPHYPLSFSEKNEPICQSFSVGRVKFIVTDLRSQRSDVTNRDTARKTMLGVKQKEWFKQELLSANGKYPLICWVSSDPWLGAPRTNYYHWVRTNDYGFFHHTNYVATTSTRTNRNNTADDDHWSVFATERREIADFIKANHISGVCILHGDSHMLAADDGSHSDYATGGGAPIPVMCAAPLDQAPSLKGGYYSQGVYRVREGEGAFGLLFVEDKGDHIDVAYSGRNNKNEEKISLKFSVPATAAVAQK